MILCLGFVCLYAFFAYATFQCWKNRYAAGRVAADVETHPRIFLKALDRTFDIVNFSNALVATVLSSIVLFADPTGETTRPDIVRLADTTIELICAYLLVELPILIYSRRNLTRSASTVGDDFKSSYDGMIVFHAIALVGTSTARCANAPVRRIALWAIWSELASVFLGIESFFEYNCFHLSHTNAYACVALLATVAFVFQRVVVFFYLSFFAWSRFVWTIAFGIQFACLLIGTGLNVAFALERCYWMASWIRANYFTSHSSIWANRHESVYPNKTH
ncbi:uncharacterized protein [Oscarella lobularis]|uniref:uncharacterized protein n=1 Tax=Oscarella lobularis TaxID=121494 RepID=UPI0033135A8B